MKSKHCLFQSIENYGMALPVAAGRLECTFFEFALLSGFGHPA
jgi:hypothetical protein